MSSLPAASGDVDLIKWNVAGEPDTLDPRNAVSYGSGQITRNMCEGLLKMDENFDVSPHLASSYEQVSDTELVLTIREGVTFWDGQPLTADDVAFSLQRSAAEDSVVSYGFIFVESIEATGPMEVTIRFTQPDASFLNGLASLSGVVMQKAWAERTGTEVGTATGGLMCTGPFRFASWRAGSGITIERNEDYWNDELRPHAARVDFSFISDDTALARALDAGEIDGSYELPAGTLDTLSDSDTGQLVFGPSTQSASLYVARPDGPLADVALRDALQRAVDREAIAEVVFSGAAEPNYTVLTPDTWPNAQRSLYEPAYDDWAEARSYDLEAARQLVEESSYDGTPVVLAIVAGDQVSSQIGQLVQQQAEQIGLNLEIQTMQPLVFEQAGYDASARPGVDLIYGSSFDSRQNPLEPLGYSFLPDQDYNYTQLDEPEVTDRLLEARSTFDADRQAELVIEAQEVYEAASTTIPLVSLDATTFLNAGLTGAITSFAYWSMPQMAYIGAAE
ncbi:ABC transporter substrate-binding protein [Geodermatophilus nigrescens]